MATTTPDRIEHTTTASPVEQHAAPTQDTAGRSGKATAGFIVGIVAIVASLIPILGIILGVVAVTLGSTSKGEIARSGKTNRWMAICAIVFGSLALVFSVAIWVGNIAMMS